MATRLEDYISEVRAFLAEPHPPEQIRGLRPPRGVQAQVRKLLAKKARGDWSSEDEREWVAFEELEHLVRMAKASVGREAAY
jgi:hypothetical protein